MKCFICHNFIRVSVHNRLKPAKVPAQNTRFWMNDTYKMQTCQRNVSHQDHHRLCLPFQTSAHINKSRFALRSKPALRAFLGHVVFVNTSACIPSCYPSNIRIIHRFNLNNDPLNRAAKVIHHFHGWHW